MERVAEVLEDDAQLMSNTQLEELLAEQPEPIQDEIVRINTDARPIALGYVHRDFVEAGTHVLIANAALIIRPAEFIPGLVGLPIYEVFIVASLAVGVAMFGSALFLGQYFQIARGFSPTTMPSYASAPGSTKNVPRSASTRSLST